MVVLQILSKVIATHSLDIIEKNLLTIDYFKGYEQEYQFIQDHYRIYGNVPDEATFLAQFPKIDLVEVTESDEYLIDKIREEYLWAQSVPALHKFEELLRTDSNAAAEYIASAVKSLRPNYRIGATDIVAEADKRFKHFQDKKNNPDNWFFETGLQELDELVKIQREEELCVIVARTNQGKSWLLEKIISHIWKLGFDVGYFSPEMSENSIGFRFDTLVNHYGNQALMNGKTTVDESEYGSYIDNLKTNEHKFLVTTLKNFGNRPTVGALKGWVVQDGLQALAIDGITYLADERAQKGDNKTTSLTNISEDLIAMSLECHIPVFLVVQANRDGVVQDDDSTPELESIRDSDGISHNATTVLSIRQKKDNILIIEIKKRRNGPAGGKLKYSWNIDTGEFQHIPSYDDAKPKKEKDEKVKNTKEQYNKDAVDVF